MTRRSYPLLLTLAAVLSACGDGWQPPQVELAHASPQIQERVARAVTEARSGDPEAVARLGDLYFALSYEEAAASCYGFAASRSSQTEHHLLAGRSAWAANQAAPARSHLEAVVELDPKHKAARLTLAEIARQGGEIDAALDRYRQVLADSPEDPQAMLGLASTHLAAEDPRQAAEWFRRVLEVRPGADRVHNSLAQAYRMLGRHDLARAQQERAGPGQVMSDDPELARIGRLRVELIGDTVLELAGRESTSAEEVAGFSVAQLGLVPGAHQRLAGRATELEGPEIGSQSAARLDKLSLGKLWFAIGALADRQANAEAAAAAYRRVLDQAPADPQTLVRLGRALLRLGKMTQAEQALAASAVNDPDVVRDRALVLRRLERHDESARVLEDAIGRDAGGQSSDGLRLDLGETRVAQGREAEAAEIHRALTTSSEPIVAATAWARIATRQQELGDDEAAAESFARAVQTAPDWLTPRYGLAATLGRLGRYDDAAREYRAILGLQPAEEEAWIGATTAAVFGGADPRAVSQFLERGLSVLPDSPQLRAALARHLVVKRGADPTAASRALELAESLVADAPSLPNRETMAMAMAASGRFGEAAALQQELLAEADGADRTRLQANLERYRAGRPCCR